MPIVLSLTKGWVAAPQVLELGVQGLPNIPFRLVLWLIGRSRKRPVIGQSKFHKWRSKYAVAQGKGRFHGAPPILHLAAGAAKCNVAYP